jgi:hypothetical protein
VVTYDPADDIVYVHMPREMDPYSAPLVSTRTCNRLPAGYANQSTRVRLRTLGRPGIIEPELPASGAEEEPRLCGPGAAENGSVTAGRH